jgi:hypothetical protein
MVFNVGDEGVKTHRDPITGLIYAYGSSANVKRNLKERFTELSGLETPDSEYKKNVEVKNNQLVLVKSSGDGNKGEQGGVSVYIDDTNPNHVANIFGAWVSDITAEEAKYVKKAIKACIKVSDMIPVHPQLQYLTYYGNQNKDEVGVSVGDRNSRITLGIEVKEGGKNVEKTLKTPEEAAELAGCSIEDAKKFFSEQRPMNLYKDKKLASGIYQETFAIEIETFGKIRLSSYAISDEVIDELVARGWRVMEIYGEKYLSPQKDVLMGLWKHLVDAMLTWDFSSNNSLHGNQKEAIRYSISMDANKINQCNGARIITNDNDKDVVSLALRDHKSVMSFNTTSLESVINCNDIETSIDADEKAREALIKLGEENIL